ncbi:arsenate reductase family protein [Brevibacillus laterosporus]|uniref:arsenate reductase family protein n=1 Tax=Brevibacillus laterosporus TaxID=1465 RepID=UPI00215BCD6B|nr:arsenate reductase family protein [Brevibacillus laterosporus]MCR8995936.1 arsenate reductase family protein [Brevibacillus laterosporus]
MTNKPSNQSNTNIRLFNYGKCSTCRKAKQWLDTNEVTYTEIPIVDTPPSKEELHQIWQNSGLDIRKFFNTSGQFYRELNLKEKLPTMSEDEMLELLASNGKLIKRPLITNGAKTTLGFKEQTLEEMWGK